MKINRNLDEALTSEEKIDAWHNGTRRENIKACGDSKLKQYLDICKDKGYLEQAKIISDELKSRGNIMSTSRGKEIIYVKNGSGKVIFKSDDAEEVEQFYKTHRTAYEITDEKLFDEYFVKYFDSRLICWMKNDSFYVLETDFVDDLLLQCTSKLIDFDLESLSCGKNPYTYKIDKNSQVAKLVMPKILEVLQEEQLYKL